MTIKEELYKYVEETYHIQPDQPFPKFPSYTAIRHQDNNKWFGLFMDVKRKKQGVDGDPEEYADILNLKCDPDMVMMISGQPGILPSYHMKSGNWITVLLDGSITAKQIVPLLDLSFDLNSSKKKAAKKKPHNPYWIVPAIRNIMI